MVLRSFLCMILSARCCWNTKVEHLVELGVPELHATSLLKKLQKGTQGERLQRRKGCYATPRKDGFPHFNEREPGASGKCAV
mmetsp:Transcript_29469/g.47275  ORF Transcript_29469/g.47275 Transcript_29469/m.47275 type:complete len:82 (+) Transcript_29469:186-431(+)